MPVWLVGGLVGWLVGWLVGGLTVWLVGGLAGWMAGRLWLADLGPDGHRDPAIELVSRVRPLIKRVMPLDINEMDSLIDIIGYSMALTD